MEALERRPLGTFASVFYISACIIFSLEADVRLWLTLLLFAVFALIVLCGSAFPYRRVLTVAAAGMLTASLFAGFVLDVGLARSESLAGEEQEITGSVTDVRYSSSWMGSYIVETDGMKICLDSDNSELRVGDIIRCTAVYRTLDGAGDFREYMLANGITLAADSVGEVTVTGNDPEKDMFRGLQRMLSARLLSAMSEENGGFASALVLGDRSALPDSISRDFRSLGISHILALSGAHLAVICSFAVSFIPERRRLPRFFVICAAAVFYMLLTGFSPSVVRSGVMLMLATCGTLANKRSDSFTSLSAAVFIICFVNPYSAYDVGLQLSYACVLGIIISSKLVGLVGRKAGKFRDRLIGALIPAITVPSLILPLMWLRFGEVSLISPVANIILVPVLTMLIPLLVILVLMSFWQTVFIPAAGIADLLLSGVLSLISRIASAIDTVIPLIGGVTATFVLLFTLSAVLALLCSGKYRACFAAASILFLGVTLVTAQGYVYMYNSDATVCTAASGDSFAACVMSDGCSILVDQGKYTSATVSAAKLGEEHGSGRFDGLLLTKLHRSHMFTVPYLCENYYIRSLWLPASYDEESAQLAHDLREEAERMGLPVFTYISGESLCVGECSFTAPAVDAEESSVTFAVNCGTGEIGYSSAAYGKKGLNLLAVSGGAIDDTVTVMPLKGAAAIGRVSEGSVIADRATVCLKEGSSPRVYLWG